MILRRPDADDGGDPPAETPKKTAKGKTVSGAAARTKEKSAAEIRLEKENARLADKLDQQSQRAAGSEKIVEAARKFPAPGQPGKSIFDMLSDFCGFKS